MNSMENSNLQFGNVSSLESSSLNHIFNQDEKYEITSSLEKLLKKNPSFAFSSYDKIRIAIITGRNQSLTNYWLIKELNKHNCLDKINDCYELAYRVNRPYIYPESKTIVPPKDYTLNFLWVNLNPQDRIKDLAQNIFKDGLDFSENASYIKNPELLRIFERNQKSLKNEDLEAWKKIKKSFTYRISKWADINSGAQINLWYDSALVTQKALQKTFEMMKSISESRSVILKLRDIRQFIDVSSETANTLHPGTPVYYRVDLLKALITDYMLSSSKENAKYCVVSDIDIKPMSSQQMFDLRTLGYLSNNGYVFNRVGLDDFENSFFIFNKEKENLQKIHNETIIQQAAFNVSDLREYPINADFKRSFILGAQSIYNLYFDFQKAIGEKKGTAPPRKVVKCPLSQFSCGSYFNNSDFRAETFRFIGSCNIPYVKNGRNDNNQSEKMIKKLMKWKAEPISLQLHSRRRSM